MEIKVSVDYTKEEKEILVLVCPHESIGDTMSILAGDLTLQITAVQAKKLTNGITIASNIIQEYAKIIKRSGTVGNGT